MYSKAKIAGHPIHTMLVSFPIAFYVATLAGYGAYWVAAEPLWFRMLEARNLSSHTYNESIANELADEIPQFLSALRALIAAFPTEV